MLARYAYDADGVRIRKVTGGTTTDYLTDGTTILQETKSGTINATLKYVYGQSGLEYILHNGNTYWPLKNQQGDIIGLAKINGDGSASLICRYEYSAFGELLSVTDANGNPITAANHIANLNPFRYRGYYYDTETGYYYLQSRYYDPEIGRFLNVDKIISGVGNSILGYNIFSYCFNNPINMSDPTGNVPEFNEILQKIKSYVYNIANVIEKSLKKLLLNLIIKVNGGISVYTGEIRICTDGSDGLKVADSDYNPNTSRSHNGQPIDAYAVPYVVIPNEKRTISIWIKVLF